MSSSVDSVITPSFLKESLEQHFELLEQYTHCSEHIQHRLLKAYEEKQEEEDFD